MSGPSNVTNRETIRISVAIAEGDFEAPFLVDVNIRKRRERLTVLVLLDTGCRLSAIIDY
jgi:hypothetical protein